MKLYLVRHGKAEDGYPDHGRALTEKGRAEFTRFSRFIRANFQVGPIKTFHSGLVRAEQTAAILVKELGLSSQSIIEADQLEPMANPYEWAKRLRDETKDIMLVGHNPYMSLMTSILVGGEAGRETVKFSKGTMVCLESVLPGVFVIRWALSPKVLAV